MFVASLLVGSALLGACAGESGVTARPTISTAPLAAVSPSASPFAQLVIKGKGAEVTDQFELPGGQYKLAWAMKAVSTCCPNLIVDLVGQDEHNLVASQDLTGSTLIQSAGGFFRFKVDSEGTTWTLTIDQL